MRQDLETLPAWRLAELLRSREVSSVELTEHALGRIERHNPALNAFLTVAPEQALAAAREADAVLASGAALGPLHGVPIAIKDLSATKGIRTTYGSLLYKDRVPDADEPAVERVRAAGAVIVGKTNTPEFGHRLITENLLGEPCRNPWDTARTPGGSSGGSGAAVAARLVPLATGSDAGGSVRVPASFCGVYGIKPTAGRVAADYRRPGGWRRLSQGGPMANDVRDAALLLGAMAGRDPRDALSLRDTPPDFAAAVDAPDVRGLRIAFTEDVDGAAVDPQVRGAVRRAAKAFEAMGARVEEAAPAVETVKSMELLMTLLLADAAVELLPALNIGLGAQMSPTLVEWADEARSWPLTRYVSALRDLEWRRSAIADLFDVYDLWLLPTMATTAFEVGALPERVDGREIDPRWEFSPFCMHANLAGNPAASVPCGFSDDGLPIGLQLVGRLGDEPTVLRASAAYEEAHPWAEVRPPGF
ncbi:MAG: amidase [Dehalococcoidia bacterium]|nr:amidase [Dehalococcoidia bacterium]